MKSSLVVSRPERSPFHPLLSAPIYPLPLPHGPLVTLSFLRLPFHSSLSFARPSLRLRRFSSARTFVSLVSFFLPSFPLLSFSLSLALWSSNGGMMSLFFSLSLLFFFYDDRAKIISFECAKLIRFSFEISDRFADPSKAPGIIPADSSFRQLHGQL